jgi:hypothetical protein
LSPRWADVTDNPNAPQLFALRQEVLNRAWRSDAHRVG